MARVPPPVYAVAAGLGQRLLAPERRRSRARSAVAVAIAAASAGLAVRADAEFKRHGTTDTPFDPTRASSLVTSGPFRFTRNPMYTGLAGLLAAHAVYRGGWLTSAPIAAYVVVIDRLQIAEEECALRELFGDAYDAYVDAVPRWVGWPR